MVVVVTYLSGCRAVHNRQASILRSVRPRRTPASLQPESDGFGNRCDRRIFYVPIYLSIDYKVTVMWNALIKLILKWAHMHKWEVERTELVEKKDTQRYHSSLTYIRIYTLQCKKCGMLKCVKCNIN